jgi:adenosylhomocysteine nucleosidase
MEDEVRLLRESMDSPKQTKAAGLEFYSGILKGKPVVLLRCGVGKVSAAVGTALLIEKYHPDYIINTGSAGGIGKGLRFGDAVISTGLVYHDIDVTSFGYAPGQIPGMPQIFPADEKLILRAEEAIEELKKENTLPGDFNHCRGLIGTGDVFMDKPERIARVREMFPDIAAVEMEGAAIAHCCHLFSIPFLVIRALSDIAGTESPVKFNEFLPVASEHSAQIVMRVTEKN